MRMMHIGKQVGLILMLALLGAGLSLPPALAQSQEEMKPAKLKNVTWYTVMLYAFKPGKRDDAIGLARKYFMPAAHAAGLPGGMVLIHETGPWDVTVIGPMTRGPSGMEWRTSPENVAWYKAFVKLAGSKEKAQQIEQRFDSYVARGTSYIAYKKNESSAQKK